MPRVSTCQRKLTARIPVLVGASLPFSFPDEPDGGNLQQWALLSWLRMDSKRVNDGRRRPTDHEEEFAEARER
jgi:hypothetical protein